ncbi:hypothetical protein BGZ80_010580 [Entomortierella chlamydospora]|uniref:Uncharacterized protein n=1 Tax=Entomortierella chlamydospora TaxID=101097 RepID=A0A9P6SZM6_9FUNG|nr:hypothetical protein BGZ80_010580 [Entomortierella chlamydospora]
MITRSRIDHSVVGLFCSHVWIKSDSDFTRLLDEESFVDLNNLSQVIGSVVGAKEAVSKDLSFIKNDKQAALMPITRAPAMGIKSSIYGHRFGSNKSK